MSRFRYITVLDFESGQVHLYDFDEMTMPDAEEVVSELHNLDYVQYMVHEYLPKLETKDLSFVADVIAENEALWLENEEWWKLILTYTQRRKYTEWLLTEP